MSHDRRTAEALHSLALSEARWQAILDTARDAIICIDRSGRITLFNRAAESMFGYRQDEVLGRPVAMLMPTPYREEHDAYLRSYQETGVAKAIGQIREVEAQRRSGEVFPIELSVSEARVGDDLIYSAIVRDVSERRALVGALRASEALFQAFMDHSPAAAFMKDEAGRYVYVNRAYRQAFQDVLTEMEGKTDREMVPAEAASLLHAHDLAALHGDESVEFVESLPGADALHEWLVWKFPVTDAAGRRLLGGMAVDITERKRAEEEMRALQELAQERGRLADIGAITTRLLHDLGNPIAGLIMQAQLLGRRLERGSNKRDELVNPVQQIIATARHLGRVMRDFKDFARQQRLKVRAVDLPRLLGTVVDLWRPVAAERAIEIRPWIERDPGPLQADEDKLRRVLDNLVKNAIEAIDYGPGEVVIAATASAPGKVRISVHDSGPGIPETVDAFRLFETTKPEGTGLGLPIAREIVEAHGGTIDLERVRPHGTAVHIELPSLLASLQ